MLMKISLTLAWVGPGLGCRTAQRGSFWRGIPGRCVSSGGPSRGCARRVIVLPGRRQRRRLLRRGTRARGRCGCGRGLWAWCPPLWRGLPRRVSLMGAGRCIRWRCPPQGAGLPGRSCAAQGRRCERTRPCRTRRSGLRWSSWRPPSRGGMPRGWS